MKADTGRQARTHAHASPRTLRKLLSDGRFASTDVNVFVMQLCRSREELKRRDEIKKNKGKRKVDKRKKTYVM